MHKKKIVRIVHLRMTSKINVQKYKLLVKTFHYKADLEILIFYISVPDAGSFDTLLVNSMKNLLIILSIPRSCTLTDPTDNSKT